MGALKNVFYGGILYCVLVTITLTIFTNVFKFKKAVTLTSECKGLCEYGRKPRSASLIDTVITLNPSYHETLVRLGTDLKLDINQCPPNSLMVNKSQDFNSRHTNCPTLFIVGARKGGTTSLYNYISRHPDFRGIKLHGPSAGETFYFGRHYNTFTWEKYTSLFPSGVMTGESSVENLVHRFVPSRLYESCGKQARVILLFRDPIQRLGSNVLMRSNLRKREYRTGSDMGNHTATVVNATLSHFLERVHRRTRSLKFLPVEWHKLTGLFPGSANMVYEGLYYIHLLNWLCNFPAENILIINSEEFFRKPIKILDIAVQFLGLKRLDHKTYELMTQATYNKGKFNPQQGLSEGDISNLLEVYRPFNKALLELLQWNNSQWIS